MPKAMTKRVEAHMRMVEERIVQRGAAFARDIVRELSGLSETQVWYAIRLLARQGRVAYAVVGVSIVATDEETLAAFVDAWRGALVEAAEKHMTCRTKQCCVPLSRVVRDITDRMRIGENPYMMRFSENPYMMRFFAKIAQDVFVVSTSSRRQLLCRYIREYTPTWILNG